MKNLLKVFGIFALAAMIGFGMVACGGDDGDGEGNPSSSGGSGKYAGKDVLGNTYSLSVGSDAAKAAVKGDKFSMEVTTRNGSKKNVTGTVTDTSTDGTLTLKQDGTNVEFSARVDGTTDLDSFTSGDLAQSSFIPRTFDNIFLRATRWTNPDDPGGAWSGENWGSGTTVLVKDFPANVSKLSNETDRYTITISGTSSVKMDNVRLEVQGLTKDNKWIWLGGTSKANNTVINANTPFSQEITLDNFADFGTTSANFADYKEIILQITNLINISSVGSPENNENYGSIPADKPDGYIMAEINNFKIVLKDKNRAALTGNMSDYVYGIQEDGLSVDYRIALWSLSAENIGKAKQNDAKLEITFASGEDIENNGAVIALVWQDPVRGLWWQDMTDPPLTRNVEVESEWIFTIADGVDWDKDEGKMTIDLSEFIKDSKFAAANEVNFIIACWYYGWDAEAGKEKSYNIDDLAITGANLAN
ncbi:MAG: hypothetical protein FWB73_07760 [Treponema sp.]|nr:hypothetical protein [Treponema sp.]